MHDWEARAKLLEAENEELRSRNQQRKEQIGLSQEPPPAFGLTKMEAVIFGVLLANKYPRNETLIAVMPCEDHESEPLQRLRMAICSMRKKLAPYNIEIKTHAGVGYEMPEASKARARELMG
jgi:hypothetical protein